MLLEEAADAEIALMANPLSPTLPLPSPINFLLRDSGSFPVTMVRRLRLPRSRNQEVAA